MDRYPHLFSEGRIGPLTTKNRIKYAATETNFNTSDGYVTDREVAYMEAQARGGSGIITTQGAYPDLKGEGKGFRGMMAISEDRFIPGLKQIADVIRKHGALSCMQILHCGREGGVDLDYSLMPSVVPQKLSYFKPPREISLDEIKQSVRDHIEAAERALTAGFDMIELSGIVGYLISTFLSSYTNKRQDYYGGDIRARARLMVEIIEGVKVAAGKSVPVGIRLCGLELLEDRGGNSFEESMESFRLAEEAGADYVSVTVGWHESSTSVITRDVPMGHWLWVAKEVKRRLNIPVMMAFRQFLPEIPERAMSEGGIDFWEACRPMIADPDLTRKAREGREDGIVPCIACNLCFSRLYYHQPIMCSVRPTLGHEGEARYGYYGFAPAPRNRKIAVVGGGPASLQFAAVAAEKGHEVRLYEERDRLGGSLHLASKVDNGAVELLRPVRALEKICGERGVKFFLGEECMAATIKALGADLVVVAGGARYSEPSIPLTVPVMSPEEAILGHGDVPRRIAILGGDGVGLGVAVFLLGKGNFELVIVEEGTKLGRDVNPFYLWQYLGLLRKGKATILTGSKILGMKGGDIIVGTPSGEKALAVNGVIRAQREPFDGTIFRPDEVRAEVHYIGDAKRPRRLNNAIHDGYHLGMEV
jgi:2,4-dienoyl-CoA reductase (NADPH2)